MGNVSKSHFDTEMGKVLKGLKEVTDSVKTTNTKVEELQSRSWARRRRRMGLSFRKSWDLSKSSVTA